MMHALDLVRVGYLRERVAGSAAGTSATLYSQPVPEGERWFVRLIAVRAGDSAGAECEVGVARSGFSHALRRLGPVSAGEFYADVFEVWLLPRERLQFEWSGVTANEQLEAHVTGDRWKEVA